MLFVGVMVSCEKDLVEPDLSSSVEPRGKAAQVKAVNLGGAGDFVILSTTGITDVSPSAITGNIGTSPITGAALTATDGNFCDEVTGKIYTVDAAGPACRQIDATRLAKAVLNMGAAYNDAAGRPTSTDTPTQSYLNVGAGHIGGLTLEPGVYTWGTGVDITYGLNLTLSGKKDAVWIFQISGTLTTFDATQVILTGGAKASNIFWQVADVVALADDFQGNVLGASTISLTSGATVKGRLLGATDVTLIQNAVTKP